MATMASLSDDEEEVVVTPLVKALAVLGFLGAAAIIVFQLQTSSIWIGAEDNPNTGDWSQLF